MQLRLSAAPLVHLKIIGKGVEVETASPPGTLTYVEIVWDGVAVSMEMRTWTGSFCRRIVKWPNELEVRSPSARIFVETETALATFLEKIVISSPRDIVSTGLSKLCGNAVRTQCGGIIELRQVGDAISTSTENEKIILRTTISLASDRPVTSWRAYVELWYALRENQGPSRNDRPKPWES